MTLSSRLTAEPRAQLAAPTELRPASVSTARLNLSLKKLGADPRQYV
jgi:hypothetical protein